MARLELLQETKSSYFSKCPYFRVLEHYFGWITITNRRVVEVRCIRKKRKNVPIVLRRTVGTTRLRCKAKHSLERISFILPQTEIQPAPITKAVSILR